MLLLCLVALGFYKVANLGGLELMSPEAPAAALAVSDLASAPPKDSSGAGLLWVQGSGARTPGGVL